MKSARERRESLQASASGSRRHRSQQASVSGSHDKPEYQVSSALPPLSACRLENPDDLRNRLHANEANSALTDFSCPICMGILWKPVRTPCGHAFCRECLIDANAFRLSRGYEQGSCPLCRHDLDIFDDNTFAVDEALVVRMRLILAQNESKLQESDSEASRAKNRRASDGQPACVSGAPTEVRPGEGGARPRMLQFGLTGLTIPSHVEVDALPDPADYSLEQNELLTVGDDLNGHASEPGRVSSLNDPFDFGILGSASRQAVYGSAPRAGMLVRPVLRAQGETKKRPSAHSPDLSVGARSSAQKVSAVAGTQLRRHITGSASSAARPSVIVSESSDANVLGTRLSALLIGSGSASSGSGARRQCIFQAPSKPDAGKTDAVRVLDEVAIQELLLVAPAGDPSILRRADAEADAGRDASPDTARPRDWVGAVFRERKPSLQLDCRRSCVPPSSSRDPEPAKPVRAVGPRPAVTPEASLLAPSLRSSSAAGSACETGSLFVAARWEEPYIASLRAMRASRAS